MGPWGDRVAEGWCRQRGGSDRGKVQLSVLGDIMGIITET